MDNYLDAVIELTYYGIQKETRLSERQVRQLRWDQIHGETISTAYKREVHLSDTLVRALALLPSQGERYVFPLYTSPTNILKRDKRKMLRALWKECWHIRGIRIPKFRIAIVKE